MVGFEVDRAAVVKRRVAAEPVVKALHVMEGGRPGVLTGGPDGALNKLGFECGEEALGGRIVETCAWATDTGASAVAGEQADIGGD